ncbi:craniofacial development protein 2 [Plakobranchus ocellatus]|uniref:Craniofacial development protein 2 n=1 Tax=Plakobranchus ocellatus TaxID=259542 RepID=A0AAV4B1Y9_9GAST|nr:craniofacial development protein 2 [Plakobranchus ocellatus]
MMIFTRPASASTVVLARGQCPIVGTQPNFNMTAFLGTWYELKSFEQGSAVCVSARYSDAGNSTYVVENIGFALQRRFRGGAVRVPLRVVGAATVPDPKRPADLLLDFDGSGTLAKTQCKSQDPLIIMDDFNAKVGTEKVDDIVEKHGLGIRNERGEKLIEWCQTNNIIVGNTWFQQPPRRKWTWKSPGDETRNQIDYMMISKKDIETHCYWQKHTQVRIVTMTTSQW